MRWERQKLVYNRIRKLNKSQKQKILMEKKLIWKKRGEEQAEEFQHSYQVNLLTVILKLMVHRTLYI